MASCVELLRGIKDKLRLVDELQEELAAANYNVRNCFDGSGRRSVGKHSDPVFAAVLQRDKIRERYNAALCDWLDDLQAAFALIYSLPACRDRLILHMIYIRGLTIGQTAGKLDLTYRQTIRDKQRIIAYLDNQAKRNN